MEMESSINILWVIVLLFLAINRMYIKWTWDSMQGKSREGYPAGRRHRTDLLPRRWEDEARDEVI